MIEIIAKILRSLANPRRITKWISSNGPFWFAAQFPRKSSHAVVFGRSKQRTRKLGRNVKFEPAFPLKSGPYKICSESSLSVTRDGI
jgi:hypothetical protein